MSQVPSDEKSYTEEKSVGRGAVSHRRKSLDGHAGPQRRKSMDGHNSQGGNKGSSNTSSQNRKNGNANVESGGANNNTATSNQSKGVDTPSSSAPSAVSQLNGILNIDNLTNKALKEMINKRIHSLKYNKYFIQVSPRY
jgi:hypothetical protein